MSTFRVAVRVYWEDTDAGGVVYYANYLRFLERCRTDWLRSKGISQQTLVETRRVQFMVLAVNIEYKAPAYLDDLLEVSCEVEPEGRTTAIFQQRIWRVAGESDAVYAPGAADERELLVEARVRVVCVDVRTLRPQRIGEYIQ
ncbi:MAG: YbgC/FadM family acyl-CoA thioesterase [Gammaproteobacteria bacterium]|nr:YbgC/FadM family acyl-CoA thioesterase [Gammaproteobacteria bacterium]